VIAASKSSPDQRMRLVPTGKTLIKQCSPYKNSEIGLWPQSFRNSAKRRVADAMGLAASFEVRDIDDFEPI
jgi:hypothetical protein